MANKRVIKCSSCGKRRQAGSVTRKLCTTCYGREYRAERKAAAATESRRTTRRTATKTRRDRARRQAPDPAPFTPAVEELTMPVEAGTDGATVVVVNGHPEWVPPRLDVEAAVEADAIPAGYVAFHMATSGGYVSGVLPQTTTSRVLQALPG